MDAKIVTTCWGQAPDNRCFGGKFPTLTYQRGPKVEKGGVMGRNTEDCYCPDCRAKGVGQMNDDTCYSCLSEHLRAEIALLKETVSAWERKQMPNCEVCYELAKAQEEKAELVEGVSSICCLAAEGAEFLTRAELADAIGKECVNLLAKSGN